MGSREEENDMKEKTIMKEGEWSIRIKGPIIIIGVLFYRDIQIPSYDSLLIMGWPNTSPFKWNVRGEEVSISHL